MSNTTPEFANPAPTDNGKSWRYNDTAGTAELFSPQPLDAELTALAGLTSAADTLPYFTGSGTASLATFTAAGRALVDDADAAAQRTTLGLGTAATQASTAFQAADAELSAIAGLTSAADRLPYFTGSGTAALATFTTAGRALVDDADAAAQRTTLGLGTAATSNTGDFQAADAELAAIAGLTSAADRLPYFTGSGTAALATFTTAGRALVDDADAAAQRTTLGLGTAATQSATEILATAQPLNAQTGTTYTLAGTDAGKLVTLSNTSAVTVTLGTAMGLTAGQRIDLLNLNTGQVTVAVGSGNTLNGNPGLKMRAQYSAASLICTATNTFVLVGDITA